MWLPTLSEMREMLGEELYVKFVWMWRDQEQDSRAIERRAKFAELLPEAKGQAKIEEWPTPAFSRVDDRLPQKDRQLPALPTPAIASPAQALHAALLRAPRLSDTIEVKQLEGLLERAGASADMEEEREVAIAGGRRGRR